jgi:xanthine dehydrogenase large subunit
VIADTLDQARKAAAAVRLDIASLPPVLTISEAIARQSYVRAPMRLERGDVDAAMAGAPHRASGRFAVGGQEHFYLEGQVAFAWIDEGGAISLHSSTQHPSEVQHICARLLGVSQAEVTVLVRRMGGGFGGKESNASWVAGVAAVACRLINRPVKLRLPRMTDMVVTGKRHGFLYDYTAGFDGEGRMLALDATLAADAG